MLINAVIGLAANLIGDALGSVGIILGGLLIPFTGWFWVDP
jgi:Co/Zn/Cd efflux system component